MTADEWLTIHEAAAATGLSESTVWRLVAAEEFPHYRFDRPRRVLFRRSDVEAWVESHARGPRPEPEPE